MHTCIWISINLKTDDMVLTYELTLLQNFQIIIILQGFYKTFQNIKCISSNQLLWKHLFNNGY